MHELQEESFGNPDDSKQVVSEIMLTIMVTGQLVYQKVYIASY